MGMSEYAAEQEENDGLASLDLSDTWNNEQRTDEVEAAAIKQLEELQNGN